MADRPARRAGRPAHAVGVGLLAAVLLAGCGASDGSAGSSDETATDVPTSPATTQAADPTPTPTAPDSSAAGVPAAATRACARVSDADLSRWAGTPMRSRAVPGSGGTTRCSPVDGANGLSVLWTLEPTDDTLAELVRTRGMIDPDHRERVELPGGVPAVLSETTLASAPVLEVIAVLDGEVVQATVQQYGGDEPLATDVFRRVAVGVAGSYAGSTR